MELRVLPKNIADMIAAGEVVQRPASVVKELMENAVDAGASDVKVIITDAGRTLIQVIDNGSGMSPEDAVLCFERHATSKLSTPEDLHHILTFGFRGEALASIAAVAEVTLKTRLRGADLGVEVTMAGSEQTGTRETATPEGSNFSVRNLFYNIPARRKFLKSDSVELRHIIEEFHRVAITRPDIAFTLTHNGKELHVLNPAQGVKFRIQDIFGASVAGGMMDISAQSSVAYLEGFLGRPQDAKKTVGNQFFFVNGRYFRSPYLHKAVVKAYEGNITDGSAPSYFIFLQIDPSAMDVNIHPTKTEIKFADEATLFQVIYGAAREAIGRSSIGGQLEFDNPQARDFPVMGASFRDYVPQGIPGDGADLSYNPFEPEATPARPSVQGYSFHVDMDPGYGSLFSDRALPSTRLVVVGGRYIISPTSSGYMIVHIRRAREKVLYSRFSAAIERSAHVGQTALFPEQVNVGVKGVLAFEENAALLSRLGFDIAVFGADTVVVNAVPDGFSPEPGKAQELVMQILDILQEETSSLEELMERNLAAKFASAAAASSPRQISEIQARELLDALLREEDPEFTASGKRIISKVSTEETEKRF